ncbi:flavin reductase family protein [Streptomyces sp. NPDC059639]|uniref:flavin reductase family protein n=1 Tax=Streptomyces sp. NPDC059639 TaxID=3346891 RepID=UPI0036C9702A
MGPDALREFFGSVPSAVSVVTTADRDGTPHGFTCTALASVSLDPPLLMVCVDESSRTLPALLRSRAFAVHLLDDDGEGTARLFAGRAVRKFDGVAWTAGAALPQVPVLSDGVLAHAECTIEGAVRTGDHRLLVGRVATVRVGGGRSLLYQRGLFASWDKAPAVVQA